MVYSNANRIPPSYCFGSFYIRLQKFTCISKSGTLDWISQIPLLILEQKVNQFEIIRPYQVTSNIQHQRFQCSKDQKFLTAPMVFALVEYNPIQSKASLSIVLVCGISDIKDRKEATARHVPSNFARFDCICM